jgi:hypothetical protein
MSEKYMDLTELLGIAGVPTFLFIHSDGYIAWHGRYSAFDYAAFSAFMRHTNGEVLHHPCPVFNCDCCKNDMTVDHDTISTYTFMLAIQGGICCHPFFYLVFFIFIFCFVLSFVFWHDFIIFCSSCCNCNGLCYLFIFGMILLLSVPPVVIVCVCVCGFFCFLFFFFLHDFIIVCSLCCNGLCHLFIFVCYRRLAAGEGASRGPDQRRHQASLVSQQQRGQPPRGRPASGPQVRRHERVHRER